MSNRGSWDFGVIFGFVGDGEFRVEVNDELQKTVEALAERAKAGAKKVSGTLAIRLKITADKNGSLIEFEPDVESKVPRKTRETTPLFIGRDGLTVENPRQQSLPLREVGGAREVRETEAFTAVKE